ncbi:TPA_exp: Uncharacterized protein A8136_4692 [Trichophyton benhamiae CBS 112371]|nr:TPA_exp: Uncharacterized protein A8136_4692 [Trichophyton benhamiae CBS 112371]
METNDDTPHNSTTDLSGPMRILAQTFTHLVPGKGYFPRSYFILNKLCQKHWNCDLDPRRHSESKPEIAQASKVQRILRKYYPFSGPPPESQREWTFRESVRSSLHQEMGLTKKELKYLRERPEDAKWLQDNLEPRFWSEIERLTQDMDERERLVAAGILKPSPGPMLQDLDDDPAEGVPIPPSEAKKYRKLAKELGRPVEELNVPWREWKKFYEYNAQAAEEGWEYMTWEEWERNIPTEN